MEQQPLDRQIWTLACLERTASPVVSCYLNAGEVHAGLEEPLQELRNRMPEHMRGDIERTLAQIESFRMGHTFSGSSSLAIFARSGEQPFFLPLEFHVPLSTSMTVDPMPNIFQLAVLRDNMNRFAILYSDEGNARILGINIGSITEEIRVTRREPAPRDGRVWSAEQLQRQVRESDRRFAHDQIGALGQLIAAHHYEHWILAGNARNAAAIRRRLSEHLAARLIAVIPLRNVPTAEVVSASLRAFCQHEEQESRAMVDRLERELATRGPAVAGVTETLRALRKHHSEVLLIMETGDLGRGWSCCACNAFEPQDPPPDLCPMCHQSTVRSFDLKEEMVRLAGQSGCRVEVVGQSDVLSLHGGAACFLRFRAPAQYRYTAA